MSASTGQQVRRGEEAGAEVGVGLADQLDQPVGDRRPQLGRHQVERQRPHVVGLGVRRQPAVGVEVLRLPGGPHLLAPARAYRAASSSRPSTRGDAGHQARRCRRRTPSPRRPCRRRRTRPSGPGPSPGSSHSPQWKPVSHRYRSCGAGSRPARGPRAGAAARGAIRSARSSQRTIVGHSSSSTCDVAVGAVDLPRHDHRGVAPAGRAVQEGDRPLPALVARASGSCWRPCRRATGRPRRRAATWSRSRRRRRGTPRSARTAASRRSSRAARGAGSRWGCRRRCRGSSRRRPRGSGRAARRSRRTSRCGAGRCARRRRGRRRRSGRPGWPSIRTYRNPCVVRRGSKTSPGHAGGDHRVDLAGRQRVRQERQVGLEVGRR